MFVRAAACALAFLCSIPAFAGQGFDRTVTMGDSLSDPGNTYVATGTFVVRPFEPIPTAPYLIGRFHFTNGPTWIEQLARDRGCAAAPARP